MGTQVPIRYKDTAETVLQVYVKQVYLLEVRMVLNSLFVYLCLFSQCLPDKSISLMSFTLNITISLSLLVIKQ